MPKLTPLRAITVTMLLPGTPCAASDIDLHAAIEMLRKKWSLPATNVERALDAGRCRASSPAAPASSRLNSRPEAAALRLCSSSPMCSACAISGFRFASASPRTATCMAVKNSVPSQRRRSITSGEFAPKRSTLPRPSLRLQNARLPAVGVLHDPHRHRRADDARPSARPRRAGGTARAPPRRSPPASRRPRASSAQPS